MSIKTAFTDGLRSFASSLINSRTATAQNTIEAHRVDESELRQIYRTGLGSKIPRIKIAYALKNTLQFESEADQELYDIKLKKPIRDAAKWMVAFGRGIIVVHQRGDDLSQPLQPGIDPKSCILSVFSGDIITATDVDRDLQSPRFYKPRIYNMRGALVHYSRVVDFTYVEPPHFDAPQYRYGGISEYELIYEQLVNDGVVQRASPRVIEKASTLFYKVRGFKDAMRVGEEKNMVDYFSRMEDIRGVMSAGLIDAEDELEVVTQTLTNLSDADQITLRRLAMVTGIPLAILIGENVKGLNSTGDNERQIFQDMIETLQDEYLLAPINQLLTKLGMDRAKFRENQGESAVVRMDYETKAITNAMNLHAMGEDYERYLRDKGITFEPDFEDFFGNGEA